MTQELQKKIDQAIRLLQQTAPKDGSPVEIAYSGGKDSDVILQLAKEAGINYRAIYKNTTIDPPGTIKHAKEMGAEVLQPKISFLKLVEQKGLPTRRARFCCEVLKEYKILDKCIVGVRREESAARAKRYQEPTKCRVYRGGVRAEQIFPILTWTEEDISSFISDRHIKCAPVYYDEQGNFHVERRLGCIGCPLASKAKRIEEYKQYPNLVKASVKALAMFFKTHNGLSRNEYEHFYRYLFCDSQQQFEEQMTGMFGRPDCKKFLEDYFHIKFSDSNKTTNQTD